MSLDNRINTIIALINSSSINSIQKNNVKIEYRQVVNVNKVAPPQRKNILRILHSTRALDTTLKAYLDFYGIRGGNHSIGQYLNTLAKHSDNRIGKLSDSEKRKYQREIVDHRNKHLHTANSYPTNDSEVSNIISEMQALVSRVVSL